MWEPVSHLRGASGTCAPLKVRGMGTNHFHSPTLGFLIKSMVDDKFLLKSHSTVPHAIEKLGSEGLDWGRYTDVTSRLIIPPKVFNGHGDQVQTQSRIPRPPTSPLFPRQLCLPFSSTAKLGDTTWHCISQEFYLPYPSQEPVPVHQDPLRAAAQV